MRITLKVISGPHKGRVFSFGGHDTFIVGRSKRAHFRLPVKDQFFSRIHFLVEVNPPQCRLMDMGSTNGTQVNGHKVTVADLKDGDRIQAGQTTMEVAVGEGEASAASLPEIVPASEALTSSPTPVSIPLIEPVDAPPSLPRAEGRKAKPSSRARPPSIAADRCRVCAAAVPSPPASGPPICPTCIELIQGQPQPIEGYWIVRPLGHGGMGVVNLAVREADGSLVALKTIIPAVAGTKTQVERFLREAKILRELSHPNIVAFREMGESNGQLFFAMDFVQGVDACKLLKRNGGGLPVPRAANLICQLLAALEYAHARKFVHRDIKPANVLVTTESGEEVVKLADFGLARVYQASHLSGLTVMGDLGGTVAFMPPEQITNFREASPTSDQYAAGATLYNLLTDRYIFDLPKHVQQQLLIVLQNDPVPIRQRRPDIPEELAAIVHRALAREPNDRFPDVRGFRLALTKYAS